MSKKFNYSKGIHILCLVFFFQYNNQCSILKQVKSKSSEEIMLEYDYKKQQDLDNLKESYHRKNCPELRLCIENCIEIKKISGFSSRGIYTRIILPCEIECQEKELCVVYEKY